jgi:1-acyl-sn-glycerol-3-phosphate acyltransferase
MPGRLFDRCLKAFVWTLFKVLHDIGIEGTRNVPSQGPVILAANHPSYLDPLYLMVGLDRPVRFLAWERLFRIPVLGTLIRRSGAISVDLDRPGRASLEAAVRVLRAGEVFGIFPEGGRSDFGVMNPLKSGVARLAMLTGAPIVPVTIRGAFRVWSKHQWLPRPGSVKVCFHPPIRLDPSKLTLPHRSWSPERREDSYSRTQDVRSPEEVVRRDREYEVEIVEQVVETINSALLPSLRAESREGDILDKATVPWSWTSDAIPIFFFAVLWLAARVEGRFLTPTLMDWWAGYIAYVALDSLLSLRGAWFKGLRARAPWLLLGLMALGEYGVYVHSLLALVAAYLALVWYSSFRFQSYRRVRFYAVVGTYALWFFHLWRSLL